MDQQSISTRDGGKRIAWNKAPRRALRIPQCLSRGLTVIEMIIDHPE